MRLSAFTPMGLLRLSGGKPIAQRIFDQMKGNLGDQFEMSIGSRMDAWCYATAIGLARAKKTAEAAAMQRIPKRASYLLPTRESEYGLIPGPNDSLADRRAAYAEAFKAPVGGSAAQIEQALRDALGDALIAYRTVSQSEIVTLSESTGLDINYQLPDVSRKTVRLLGAISTLATQVWVGYELVNVANSDDYQDLIAGDRLVFEPGRLGITEAVDVLETSIDGSGNRSLLASFERTHDVGVLGLTHPYPGWSTTQRHSLIVLTLAAAQDPESRRKVDRIMRRMARSVSTWDIVAQSGSNVLQFQLNSPSLGISTLASFAI